MTPKNCHSVFHYSRIRTGKKLLDFFFSLKIVQGRYFNIFNQTAVVYLYYNCHQDPYLPSVQRGADVSCFFIPSILWGCHLHCKRRFGCVCWDLTWRLEGRETAQSKVVIGVVTRGPSDTDSWLTKPLESTTWNSCLGKWKAALWKDLFFFFHPTQTNWRVTADSNTMTYCCHGIDCVHAMSGTHCGEDISVIFIYFFFKCLVSGECSGKKLLIFLLRLNWINPKEIYW